MRRKFNVCRDERGMTVVEVVAALAIVSLVLVSLWEGYNLAELSRRKALMQQCVAQVAEELLGQAAKAADGRSGSVETQAGTLQYTWQVLASPLEGLNDMALTITDETVKQKWYFVTVVHK